MMWNVKFTAKAVKQERKLPEKMKAVFKALVDELVNLGPYRDKWPNYGKLCGQTNCHHCHLNKGNPRYVAVWKVTEKNLQIIEVRYVGTHEKADYRRIC